MTLVFDPEAHVYTLNGKRLPSVTQIIRAVNGDHYADIPENVLKEKAEWGNKVHEWIETYAMTGRRKRVGAIMKLTTDQIPKVLTNERIIIHSVEVPLCTDHYAGIYDMLGTWRGVPTLFDIKTTYDLNIDSLEWQLGMYKEATEHEIEKCACLWCPKERPVRVVEITPKTKEDIDWMVYRYETEHSSGQ